MQVGKRAMCVRTIFAVLVSVLQVGCELCMTWPHQPPDCAADDLCVMNNDTMCFTYSCPPVRSHLLLREAVSRRRDCLENITELEGCQPHFALYRPESV